MDALGLAMRMEREMRWMFCSSLGERLIKIITGTITEQLDSTLVYRVVASDVKLEKKLTVMGVFKRMKCHVSARICTTFTRFIYSLLVPFTF